MNFECYFNEILWIIKYFFYNIFKIVLKLFLFDFFILKRKWVFLINNEFKMIKLVLNDIFFKGYGNIWEFCCIRFFDV